MVNSLLDVSRMEAGQMPLHCEESDLGQLTSAALKQLSGLIKDRQISVRGSDLSVLAYCDLAITQRIFENLLGNALKFTPEEGSVQIELAVEGSWARFSITDTGPGIPVEYHNKVFEKFGQVEMRKDRKTPSSGLGLAFCKLAVEAQGGSIQLESEPGHGSTFHVRLPTRALGTSQRNAA
jgi:signal transduction histidine kinase